MRCMLCESYTPVSALTALTGMQLSRLSQACSSHRAGISQVCRFYRYAALIGMQLSYGIHLIGVRLKQACSSHITDFQILALSANFAQTPPNPRAPPGHMGQFLGPLRDMPDQWGSRRYGFLLAKFIVLLLILGGLSAIIRIRSRILPNSFHQPERGRS